MKPVRILWISDSPNQPSGYGTVTENICRRLRQRGYSIDILGWQTRGAPARHHDITVWPSGDHEWAADVLPKYLQELRPDVLVSLGDVYALSYLATPEYRRRLDSLGTRWVFYYPIEAATPASALPPNWVDTLAAADVRVTVSTYGRDVSAVCGLSSEYIPHGVDTALFRPPEDKNRAKARLGYEGKFVILSDTLNQTRKMIPRALNVVAEFLRRHEDAIYHMHCDPLNPVSQDYHYRYDVREDIAALGLTGRVRFTQGFEMSPSGGLPMEEIADIYAAADVHLLCSYGEGFGLPTLQAAGAGVVPIAVEYSASRELVEGHGFAIPAENVVVDDVGFARHLMSCEAAVDALERMYRSRDELAARSAACRAFAMSYDWERITDQWELLLMSNHRHRVPGSAVSPHDPPRKGYLSIPVRLPRQFGGSADAQWILTGPGDITVATDLQRVFPEVGAVVTPQPSPNSQTKAEPLLQRYLGALLRSVVALDFTPGALPGIDYACAALGVPYVGRSDIWPEIAAGTPFLQARRLLTDHGLSQWRLDQAMLAAESRHGRHTVEHVRDLARAAALHTP